MIPAFGSSKAAQRNDDGGHTLSFSPFVLECIGADNMARREAGICESAGWQDQENSMRKPCSTQQCSASGAGGGNEATSVRDLIDKTRITGASLYNAFGDKRALFIKSLDRYVETALRIGSGVAEALPPREAIEAFFSDVLKRSLEDPERKGCMLVNTASSIYWARA
jgi:TetR/AcrR family transcriptional repressor of nem operon